MPRKMTTEERAIEEYAAAQEEAAAADDAREIVDDGVPFVPREPKAAQPRVPRSRASIAAEADLRRDMAVGRREVIEESTDDPAHRAELLAELEADLRADDERDAAELAEFDAAERNGRAD